MARRALEEILADCVPPATLADGPVIDLRSEHAGSPTPGEPTENPAPSDAGATTAHRATQARPSSAPGASTRGAGRTPQGVEYTVGRDQHKALDDLLFEVSRRRTAKPERLSRSALVRIAIDALLEHSAALQGNTEAELAESLHRHLRRAFE